MYPFKKKGETKNKELKQNKTKIINHDLFNKGNKKMNKYIEDKNKRKYK